MGSSSEDARARRPSAPAIAPSSARNGERRTSRSEATHRRERAATHRDATHRERERTERITTPESMDSGGRRGGEFDDSPRQLTRGGRTRDGRDGRDALEGMDRRQGLVFEDTFETGDAVLRTMPSERRQSNSTCSQESTAPGERNTSAKPILVRPRNKTIDTAQRHPSAPISMRRQRVASNHGTLGSAEDISRSVEDGLGSPHSGSRFAAPQLSAQAAFRQQQAQRADSVKKKPPVSGRLVKNVQRAQSRSRSPTGMTPIIDTLQIPMECSDANRLVRLMGNLNGRMRGEVEYQTTGHESWARGMCYVDERGMLMYEGSGAERAVFHQTLVPDLRGCMVLNEDEVLDVMISNGMRLRLRPMEIERFEFWLAALLHWQQQRPGTANSESSITRPESRSLSRRPSFNNDKNFSIIKIGKVGLWDKGEATPQTLVGKKPTPRDARRLAKSWEKVSCILQDNGEFKLMTEEIDTTLLATIQLSQLSRSAIQQLDKTVLNQENCIAIFPQYTPGATSLSIIKPIYISLETRVLFEVWFVLLRAFTVPEIYGSQFATEDEEDNSIEASADLFRIDKTLNFRVVEAKIKPSGLIHPSSSSSSSRASEKPSEKEKKKEEHRDPSIADYFAEVVLDGEVRSRTTTKANTLRPFWREDCEFGDLPATLPEVTIVLKKIGIERPAKPPTSAGGSKSSLASLPEEKSEIVCGVVQIKMDQLERGKDVETWWPIVNKKMEIIGEMLVKIRHDELVVLLQKDYQQLSELLHKFNSGLTVQMSAFVPSKLRFLAETLLDVFQVSGQSAQWLVALVEDEIDGIGKETPVQRLRFSRRVGSNGSQMAPTPTTSEREVTVRDMNRSLAGEANLLFRGNSLLTQALDCHMRRIGSDYLCEVLGAKVREINERLPGAEVDPSRIGEGEELKKNWTTLNKLTTEMWARINTSYSRCPSELRQVLKYIRAVAEDRYGDFLRTVPYTSVSGFLFLRFFCPALLNPKLFGLLRDHPAPKAQRTLTLIAKSLQVLANLGSFGQKEAWMEPMNAFLARNRQSVKGFIDNVCDIPTERSRMPPPPSYSTPLAILRRLSNERKEGWLSLPFLIDDARTFAALVRFWLEATKGSDGEGDKLESAQGDLRKFHDICLILQKRTDECLLKAEAAASHPSSDSATSPEDEELAEIMRSLEGISVVDQRSFTESDLMPTTSLTSVSSDPLRPYQPSQPGPAGPAIKPQVANVVPTFQATTTTRITTSGQNNLKSKPKAKPRTEPRIEPRIERWNEAGRRQIPGSASSDQGSSNSKDSSSRKERGSIWSGTLGKSSSGTSGSDPSTNKPSNLKPEKKQSGLVGDMFGDGPMSVAACSLADMDADLGGGGKEEKRGGPSGFLAALLGKREEKKRRADVEAVEKGWVEKKVRERKRRERRTKEETFMEGIA